MQKPVDCRQHAQDCRVLAMRAISAEQKAHLEAMATTWDTLAVQREKMLHCRMLCAA
jgi:hypothetical protein